jgi:RimJ/RimL family protein N-acetyltransferase
MGVAPMSLGTGATARLERALRYRDDVRAWGVSGGVLILGRGVAGRWEVSVELEPDYRGQRLGRDLITAARHLVPGGAPLWAQIAPGNAASVRAFLAAGYQPVGAEALFPLD